MILFLSSTLGSRCSVTFAPIFLFLLTLASIHSTQASPLRSFNSSSHPQHSLASISNMASMRGYLTPKCTRSSMTTFISLQDCYGALSRLPFNASDVITLSHPASQSANTCSITVSRVIEKNADSSDQDSLVNVYAPTLFGPVGQILTSCSNQAGTLYLWAGGQNLQLKIDTSTSS